MDSTVCKKAVFVNVLSGFQCFFLGHDATEVKYYFPGNVPHQWRFQLFKEMKKYHFEVELQRSELNLGLRKTTMIVRDDYFSRNHARNVKYDFHCNVQRGWRFQ